MYLIKSKISGKDLPETIPASLIPPSLRQAGGQSAAPAAERDLFDAFGDSPPASANAATSFFTPAPQSPAAASPPSSSFANSNQGFGMTPFGVPSTMEEDLFGDETPFTPSAPAPAPSALAPPAPARSPAPSNSRSPPPPPPPELAKLRTETSTLSRSVSDLQSSGLTLENQTLETAKEIMDLQAKLVGLRATHDSEKGNVDKLKAKAAEHATQLKTLSSDLIRAESELSGLRGEKTDVDGQMMRDKEDIREMKRRMVEIGEQTTQLQAQVEKAKRDARQQKGLLTITKKQVGTAEADKDKATAALADAERGVGLEDETPSPVAAFAPSATSAFAAQHHASQVPLPETPERMLSPALSVTSQKSNNPFDRFVPTPPAARSPAAPVKELAEESPAADVLPTSPVSHVKELAIGGVVAAGTALAGVGAAIFGSSSTEEDDKKVEEEKEVKAEEPTAAQSFAASTFDDSFGASPPSTQTPFAPAASDSDATKAFDAGFDDGFDDKFDATPASPFPAADGPASPSEVPFSGNGFESTFGDEFTPVKPNEDEIVTSPAKEVTPTAVEAGSPKVETPTAPVASAFVADEVAPTASSSAQPIGDTDDVEEIDSSDDEHEGPEDLDAGYKPSVIAAAVPEGKGKGVDPTEHGDDAPHFPELEEEPTSEPSSNLTSTASAFGTDDSIPPAPAAATGGHPFDDAFEPTPPTTIISPPADAPSRRAAPPPPPSRNSVNVPAAAPAPAATDAFGASPFEASPFEAPSTGAQESSPFESSPFDAEEPAAPSTATAFSPAATAPALDAFSAPATQTSTSSQGPAVASFDDDFDRDFDDVPAAKDLPSSSSGGQHAPPPPPAPPHPTSTTSPIGAGFDDFDDFSTDFDPVPTTTAPGTATTSSAAVPAVLPNSAYAVDPSFADFDSAFGETPPASARPAAPTSGFSFDDAFGDEPAAAPSTSAFAPPPGPPPGMAPVGGDNAPSTPTRPALPSRKTAAEVRSASFLVPRIGDHTLS